MVIFVVPGRPERQLREGTETWRCLLQRRDSKDGEVTSIRHPSDAFGNYACGQREGGVSFGRHSLPPLEGKAGNQPLS